MEGFSVSGKNGEFIKSAMEMVLRFSAEVTAQIEEWQLRLKQNPGELELIEHPGDREDLSGAGQLSRRPSRVTGSEDSRSFRQRSHGIVP